MGGFDGWQVLYSMSVGMEPLRTGSPLGSFQDFLRTFLREDAGAQQSYSNHPEQARVGDLRLCENEMILA